MVERFREGPRLVFLGTPGHEDLITLNERADGASRPGDLGPRLVLLCGGNEGEFLKSATFSVISTETPASRIVAARKRSYHAAPVIPKPVPSRMALSTVPRCG